MLGTSKHPFGKGGTLGVEITMKELLEAGVHFGHQTRRWNPKMKEYIFGERNGIHIIDLQKTLKMFRDSARFISEVTGAGKTILFVGTKRQAQEAVKEEAQRCGMFFVNQRWLGGTLTNWATLQKSIKRLKELKAMIEDGRMAQLSKKEAARLERELKHLQQNLEGIENMATLPDAIFIVDSNSEEIAVREARRMGIPVVSVVDTNCDPDLVDWVIPGNDDALRAIRLFTSKVADAVIEGRAAFKEALARNHSMVGRRPSRNGISGCHPGLKETRSEQLGKAPEVEVRDVKAVAMKPLGESILQIAKDGIGEAVMQRKLGAYIHLPRLIAIPDGIPFDAGYSPAEVDNKRH